MTGCSANWTGFFAPQFEDVWWQPAEYDWCFNFHYSDDSGVNELLWYENQSIQNMGPWTLEEPNIYHVEDYSVTVWESGDCWELEIKPFSLLAENLHACECTIR